MHNWFIKNKNTILRAGGSSLALFLLILLLHQQGWEEIFTVAKSISPWRLALAMGLLLISRFFVAIRWYMLLRADNKVSLWRTLAIAFTGLFASNFLPTTIGGDVARLAGAIKIGLDRAVALASLIADRLIGMAGMTLLLPLGLWQFWAWSSGQTLATSISLVGFWHKGKRYFSRVLEVMVYWIKKPGTLITSLLFTFGHMICNITALYIILQGLKDPLNWWTIAGLSSLTYFIALMPISINGYGLQELSMTFIYSNVGGISTGSAFVLALLHRLMLLLASVPGAFFLPSIMSDQIEIQDDEFIIHE